MRYILFYLLLGVCVFCQNSVGAENAPAAAITFEVHSILSELRPLDINELAATFEKSTDFDSDNVAAIENLNSWNVFHEVDAYVGYKIYFEFYADVEGEWQFDFVYDAGIASGVLVDRKVILFSDLDMFLDLANPIVKKVVLAKGWHKFEFLALENCCGAPIRFRVKKPNSDEFKIISESNLQLRKVTQ
jgi:hypothetical protein